MNRCFDYLYPSSDIFVAAGIYLPSMYSNRMTVTVFNTPVGTVLYVLIRLHSKVCTAIRVHSLHRSLYRLLQYEGTIERYCTLYSVQ